MDFPLAESVEAVSKIGAQALSYYQQKNLDRQQRADEQKRAERDFSMQLDLARQSPLAQIAGVKQAGLSPALASEGKFSAPSLATAPLGHSSAPSPVAPDIVGAMKNSAEIALLEAEAKKATEEGEEKRLKNEGTNAQQNAFDSYVRGFIDQKIEDSKKSGNQAEIDTWSLYKQVLEQSALTTKGNRLNTESLAGIEKAFEMLQNNPKSSAMAKAFDNEFNARLNKAKIDNNTAQDLARLPRQQILEIASKIAQAYASISLMQSEALKNASDVEVNEELKLKIKAEIDNLFADTKLKFQETQTDYHRDYASMVKNDDWKALFTTLSVDAFKAAASALGFGVGVATGGKAVAVGSKVAGKALTSLQKLNVGKSDPFKVFKVDKALKATESWDKYRRSHAGDYMKNPQATFKAWKKTYNSKAYR